MPRSSVLLTSRKAIIRWSRYEVLPTGFKPSSDVFNIQSDRCTRGVPEALKSVDDVLTQGRTYRELKHRLIILFKQFRHYNIKIKTSKFRIGQSVRFGGFICGSNE